MTSLIDRAVTEWMRVNPYDARDLAEYAVRHTSVGAALQFSIAWTDFTDALHAWWRDTKQALKEAR